MIPCKSATSSCSYSSISSTSSPCTSTSNSSTSSSSVLSFSSSYLDSWSSETPSSCINKLEVRSYTLNRLKAINKKFKYQTTSLDLKDDGKCLVGTLPLRDFELFLRTCGSVYTDGSLPCSVMVTHCLDQTNAVSEVKFEISTIPPCEFNSLQNKK